MASWIDRLISSMIILLPPRQKIVTAFELAHSSMTTIFSLVVPNETCSRRSPPLACDAVVHSKAPPQVRFNETDCESSNCGCKGCACEGLARMRAWV